MTNASALPYVFTCCPPLFPRAPVQEGDLWTLASAILFGVHMLRSEHHSRLLPPGQGLTLMSLQVREGGGAGASAVRGESEESIRVAVQVAAVIRHPVQMRVTGWLADG